MLTAQDVRAFKARADDTIGFLHRDSPRGALVVGTFGFAALGNAACVALALRRAGCGYRG